MTKWKQVKDIFNKSYDRYNSELIELINNIEAYHPEIIDYVNSLHNEIVYTEEALAILRAIDNNFWWESQRPLKIYRKETV